MGFDATAAHPVLEGHVTWCRLAPAGHGASVLSLAGRLPRGWSVRLSRGLAQRGASLLAGAARRVRDDAWLADFHLEPGPARVAVEDCEAWVVGRARAAPVSLPLPRILDFTLAPEPGSVTLEVHAWDGVGLLAAVLERVWSCGLRPAALALDTEDECAFQSLVLTDDACHMPSSTQCEELANALRRLCAGS